MRKILFLISTIKQDGPNRVLENMIYGLKDEKFEVYVMSFLKDNDKKSVSRLEKLGAKIVILNLNKKIEIITIGKEKLNQYINKLDPDFVHSHGILPDIVNAKSVSKRKFTTIHNNMFEDYIFSFGKLKGSLIIYWHKYYLKKFDRCVCCSKSIYDVLCKKISNCSYVENSIFKFEGTKNYSELRDEVRNEYSISKEATVYIYVGVLTNRKNVMQMIEKFNELLKDNEYLLIVGDGPQKEELIKNVISKNIIFCGFQKDVIKFYCASDIYCSFSLSEGFSISVLEALEYKNLLLLSSIPSHKEIFEINQNLYIGEYFNFSDFEQKKNSVVKKKNNGVNDSCELLKNELNCNKMMEKYMDIYEGVMK